MDKKRELISDRAMSKMADEGSRKATKAKRRKRYVDIDGLKIPSILPILPVREMVVFPGTPQSILVMRPKSLRLTDDALSGNRIIGVFAQKDKSVMDPKIDDIYQIGTVAFIVRSLRFPDGSMRILVQGISRAILKSLVSYQPYIKCEVEIVEEKYPEDDIEIEGLTRNVLRLFQKVLQYSSISEDVMTIAMNIEDKSKMADYIAANLPKSLRFHEKQDLISTIDLKERLMKLVKYLMREVEILEIGNKIQSEVEAEVGRNQREYFLRQELEAIQRELNIMDEKSSEIEELKRMIEESGMPEVARKEAERELQKLMAMPPASAEYTVSRTYLDWLTSLPWNKGTEDNLDIARAAQILDEDHYDLQRVKDRILEYLAVRKLKMDPKGPILCFVGPPGVGKTSLGQSIARALGRKFIRISLGGMRDEAEIRGHRRTYVGALPGRIIQGIRKAESNNPVFMLDEIDKLGMDFRGDPSSALLEVLDPQQNNSFTDHYLGVPFDLSRVLFITTANFLDPVPPALKDRLEVIEIPGYTEDEKLNIAKGFLIPRQIKENGLEGIEIEITDESIRTIIREYTREAGVRNLERELASIMRKIARAVAEGSSSGPFRVDKEDVATYLGPPKFKYGMAGEEDEIATATGLVWTPVGGDIVFIEVSLMSGKGELILTGSLGEVMKESAKAALSYIRSNASKFGIEDSIFSNIDIHIHVPEGAIPKDGPSAGVAIATALLSALCRKPVRKDVAMTGEITLRGRLLPVGGIKEKVLGAHRAGIKTVILPKDNEKDLIEVPEQVKEELRFVFAEHLDETFEISMGRREGEVNEEKS